MKTAVLILSLFQCWMLFAQQTETVDFIRVKASVEPVASKKKVYGQVEYTIKMLQHADSVFLDAVNMKLDNLMSPKGISITSEEKKIWISGDLEANKEYTFGFSYEATPRQTLYFIGDQIWTQGQGKYTSHWLPSIDDMNDKIEFDLSVIAEKDHTVVANGRYYDVSKEGDKRRWSFDMKQPMSSYLVAIVVGDFNKRSFFSETGHKIELYFRPEDSNKVEPTYRYTKEIFEFLEQEIGVAYPWQNYKQVPVRDFLYAGMENTTATVFSEAFVVDSIGFIDRNYVNVNAHELAHQWFGNLVTETEGTHHWLQEGFATYYALLAERDIFGDDYYYWKLFQTADQLQQTSDAGKGEALLNPKASSLTFYEKGAWALHILKEVVGEELFKAGIKNYLMKHQFQNVTTQDFIAEMEITSGKDLTQWKSDWLEQSAFKASQAYQSLLKSDFINSYFQLASQRPKALDDKRALLDAALTFPNDFIGQEAIIQLNEEPIEDVVALYKKAFESNNLMVRQAIALSMDEIPAELKQAYESLLKDPSYLTQETTLYNLWIAFPEGRSNYLNLMQETVGFQDKNVRQLWLFLALITTDYFVENRPQWEAELKSYTSPSFSFEIREKAFGYVHELQIYDREVLRNLSQACVHHNWRFRNSCRKLMDQVLTREAFKNTLIELKSSLNAREQAFLDAKL